MESAQALSLKLLQLFSSLISLPVSFHGKSNHVTQDTTAWLPEQDSWGMIPPMCLVALTLQSWIKRKGQSCSFSYHMM